MLDEPTTGVDPVIPQALKQRFIPGEIVEITTPVLLPALSMLEIYLNMLCASLSGDKIHLIVEAGMGLDHWITPLKESGIEVLAVQKGEPVLEDVFINLAKEV